MCDKQRIRSIMPTSVIRSIPVTSIYISHDNILYRFPAIFSDSISPDQFTIEEGKLRMNWQIRIFFLYFISLVVYFYGLLKNEFLGHASLSGCVLNFNFYQLKKGIILPGHRKQY